VRIVKMSGEKGDREEEKERGRAVSHVWVIAD
jgi:hypothetical protein